MLYGGGAIGGVVNAIDNRIPKYSLSGVSGAAEVRLGGPENERGASALVEVGNGDFALHVDGFKRKTDDLRVPTYTPVDAEGNVLERTDRVRNSASDAKGGAVGGAYTFRSGYIGLSADTYRNDYGVTAEEGVTIKMDRQRYALAGEVRDLSGPFRTVRAQVNHTHYEHQEVEETGEIGTTFKTSGTEVRVEAEHAPIGPVKGVIGAQFENFDFSALGEEAFVPTTNTRRRALFVVEEWASPIGKVSFGGRIERDRVSSEGDADPADAKFGPPQERSFTLYSGSIGNVYALDREWSVSGNFSTTARAPTSFELFANGVHAATGAFEVGDPNLAIERGNNIDVALQWKNERSHARLGVFAAQFSNYISLEDTGTSFTDGDRDVPGVCLSRCPCQVQRRRVRGLASAARRRDGPGPDRQGRLHQGDQPGHRGALAADRALSHDDRSRRPHRALAGARRGRLREPAEPRPCLPTPRPPATRSSTWRSRATSACSAATPTPISRSTT